MTSYMTSYLYMACALYERNNSHAAEITFEKDCHTTTIIIKFSTNAKKTTINVAAKHCTIFIAIRLLMPSAVPTPVEYMKVIDVTNRTSPLSTNVRSEFHCIKVNSKQHKRCRRKYHRDIKAK